jgi:hypothetical protein
MATMSFFDYPAEYRESLGMVDNLVRLALGLEDPEDLIADLYQALDRIPTQSHVLTILRGMGTVQEAIYPRINNSTYLRRCIMLFGQYASCICQRQ